MESIGLGGEANAGRRLTVMRAIDKLDRLGVEGVRLLLGAGRKDESGDFTKGAGLDAAATEQVLALLNGDGAVRFGDGVEGQRPPSRREHRERRPNRRRRRWRCASQSRSQ